MRGQYKTEYFVGTGDFFYESFHLSDEYYSTDESEDEERDILNSLKDPLKSRNIVFWSCSVTLFGSYFNCAKNSCILQLLWKGLAVIATIICETGHESKWSS